MRKLEESPLWSKKKKNPYIPQTPASAHVSRSTPMRQLETRPRILKTQIQTKREGERE